MIKKDAKEALTQTYQKELKEVKEKVEKIELTYDANEDYEMARQLLHRLIARSEEALDNLLALTQESEHPRAYEVLSGLLKTAGDLSDQLINLQKKRHELDYLNNPAKKNSTNQLNPGATNNVFIGSTAELQRFLQQEKQVYDVDAEDAQSE